MKKTATLILAAGKSSRMGSPKQLLPYKTTTLLGWTVEQALQSKTNAVFCVIGANATPIKKSIEKYPIEIIFNANFNNGLSTSIVAGINYLKNKKFDTVLILLADQPNVTAHYLNELITASKENKTKIIASTYNESVGVPAVFPKQYFQQLLKLSGDTGAKKILEKHQKEIISIKPINLIDIDTVNEYRNLY